jgi:hypothetical protein
MWSLFAYKIFDDIGNQLNHLSPGIRTFGYPHIFPMRCRKDHQPGILDESRHGNRVAYQYDIPATVDYQSWGLYRRE